MMHQDYRKMVTSSIKNHKQLSCASRDFNNRMRVHQVNAVDFALEKGSAALFLDTGLGKTLCALSFADNVYKETGRPVLMLCPLGVRQQHLIQAQLFDFDNVKIIDSPDEIIDGINLVNYEKLHLFNPQSFGGLILDESSIIKNYSGKTTRALMDFGQSIAFKLACSATPAPNDYMEFGQHAQFLGVMSSSEMLARWFIADQSEMGKYRIKRHGIESFWNWVSSWARFAQYPSDLGGCDDGFILPKLQENLHIVKTDITLDRGFDEEQQRLFRMPVSSATSIHYEKRKTSIDRAMKIADCVESRSDEPWIHWVDTDYDADELIKQIPGAVNIHGKMNDKQKQDGLRAFENGNIQHLITKSSIAGFGLNWQHCSNVSFMSLSYSYESYYQCLRRCYRFGQTKEVNCNIVMAETESAIYRTHLRKKDENEKMKMHMRAANVRAVQESHSVKNDYVPMQKLNIPNWLGV